MQQCRDFLIGICHFFNNNVIYVFNTKMSSKTNQIAHTEQSVDSVPLEKENLLMAIAQTGESVVSISSGKGTLVQGTHSKEKTMIDWIFQHEFEIDAKVWEMMHDGGVLKAVANDFFIKFMNHCLPGIPCVLNKFGGYSLASSFFVMLFKCGHKTCGRLYKIEQIGSNKFIVYNNNTEIVHTKKVTRSIRGTQLRILEKAMLKMLPSEYREFCEKTIDRKLCKLGNMQECPSDTTLYAIRSKALRSLDFDDDDVYDILKMKLCGDFKCKLDPTQDVYIRRFYLEPYMVIAFSDSQFECLKLLADKFEDLKIFLDATGSIARHLGKILFYYAGVIAAKLNSAYDKEVSRLLPIIEFLSGEHDAFNISVPLSLYKHHFHRKYPSMEWPLKHCVTDFSFALLNAVCQSWNNMKLITYVNYTYLLANGDNSMKDMKNAGIDTFLQLCIGHLSKTHSKDVSKYYQNCKNMSALKEIFAGFFDADSLETLRKIWKDLSTILLSKCITEKVQNSLKSLALIITKTPVMEEEDTDVDDDKLPIDVHEHQSIYKQSLFYQNFKALTYKLEFASTTKGTANAFYSPEYADVFLKKYVSLLSLWTCLTQSKRSANSCGECHFKNTKQRLNNKSRSIGSMPLKQGRFLRELESYSKATSSAVLDEIPKNQCCDQNKKKSNKRRNEEGQEDYPVQPPKKRLMDLYKKSPKISKTATTERSAAAASVNEARTTSTSNGISFKPRKVELDQLNEVDSFIQIDDPNSKEQWKRKSKNKFSYIEKLNLRKINQIDNRTELIKILKKTTSRKDNKTTNNSRIVQMKNNLIDNPATYLAPGINFVISGIGKLVLRKDDYKTLQGLTLLSIPVMQFLFAIFNREANKVQFEIIKTSMIVDNNVGVIKINKDIFVGALLKYEHFTLVIINCKNRCFSLIDPKTQNPPETDTYFDNFKKFIVRHNKKYIGRKIPEDNWRIFHLQHHLEEEENDSGVFVLNFVKQYLDTGKIDRRFTPGEYRVYLQHFILQKSKKMSKMCVLCGQNLPKNIANTSSQATCDSCMRGTHLECLNKVEEDFNDDTLNFFCIICKSNTIDLVAENME